MCSLFNHACSKRDWWNWLLIFFEATPHAVSNCSGVMLMSSMYEPSMKSTCIIMELSVSYLDVRFNKEASFLILTKFLYSSKIFLYSSSCSLLSGSKTADGKISFYYYIKDPLHLIHLLPHKSVASDDLQGITSAKLCLVGLEEGKTSK